MTAIAPKLLLAGAIGISLSSVFAGVSGSLSYMAVPSLLLSASGSSSQTPATNSGHVARQWKSVYDIGKKAGPPLAIGSAAAFVTASQLVAKGATLPRNIFIAAAICNVLILPFTGIFMGRTNNELMRRAKEADSGVDEVTAKKDAKQGTVESLDIKSLLSHWASLNATRGLLHVTAIGLALTALLS